MKFSPKFLSCGLFIVFYKALLIILEVMPSGYFSVSLNRFVFFSTALSKFSLALVVLKRF